MDERARERVVERVAHHERRHRELAARDALLEEVRAFPAVRHAPATRHVHERDTSIRHLFSEDKGAHAGSRKQPVEVDYRSGSIRFEVAVDVVDPAGGL